MGQYGFFLIESIHSIVGFASNFNPKNESKREFFLFFYKENLPDKL